MEFVSQHRSACRLLKIRRLCSKYDEKGKCYGVVGEGILSCLNIWGLVVKAWIAEKWQVRCLTRRLDLWLMTMAWCVPEPQSTNEEQNNTMLSLQNAYSECSEYIFPVPLAHSQLSSWLTRPCTNNIPFLQQFPKALSLQTLTLDQMFFKCCFSPQDSRWFGKASSALKWGGPRVLAWPELLAETDRMKQLIKEKFL